MKQLFSTNLSSRKNYNETMTIRTLEKTQVTQVSYLADGSYLPRGEEDGIYYISAMLPPQAPSYLPRGEEYGIYYISAMLPPQAPINDYEGVDNTDRDSGLEVDYLQGGQSSGFVRKEEFLMKSPIERSDSILFFYHYYSE